MVDHFFEKYILVPFITWMRKMTEPVLGPDDIGPFPHFQPSEEWYNAHKRVAALSTEHPQIKLNYIDRMPFLSKCLFWYYRPGKAIVFSLLLVVLLLVLKNFVHEDFIGVAVFFLFCFGLATGEAYYNAKNILQAMLNDFTSKKALQRAFKVTTTYFDFQHEYYVYFYKHQPRDWLYMPLLATVWAVLLAGAICLCIFI